MITGGGHISVETFRFEVDNVAGERSFELPFILTSSHLVYIGGIVTDITYTGIGKTIIVLSQNINKGESIIIK